MSEYKVAYNACYGGFGLSKEASEYLNTHWGCNINPEYGYINEDVIPRHHKGLIEVIELLGEKANGFCAKLKVVTISIPMYRVDDCDGNETVETVETPDSCNWVVINE